MSQAAQSSCCPLRSGSCGDNRYLFRAVTLLQLGNHRILTACGLRLDEQKTLIEDKEVECAT